MTPHSHADGMLNQWLINLFVGPTRTLGPGSSMSGSLSFLLAGSSLSGSGSSANKLNLGRPRPAKSILLTLRSPNASSGSRCNRAAPGPMMPSLRTHIRSLAIRLAESTSEVVVPKRKHRSSCEASKARLFPCNTIQTGPPAPSCSKPPSKFFSATARRRPISAMAPGSSLSPNG